MPFVTIPGRNDSDTGASTLPMEENVLCQVKLLTRPRAIDEHQAMACPVLYNITY